MLKQDEWPRFSRLKVLQILVANISQDLNLIQEDIHTRRMAIANGTCISFCNQPKAHFGLPWDNRGRCHMDEKRIQCLSKHMYPSIFNHFPVIQPGVRHFSTFFAHFGLPGYAPGTIAVNVTWIKREFNACQTHRSMYTSRELKVKNYVESGKLGSIR